MFDFYTFPDLKKEDSDEIMTIESVKKQMIRSYLKLMMFILVFYSVIFIIGGLDQFIIGYTFLGSLAVASIVYVTREVSSQKILRFVQLYLFIAPLYNLYFFIILFRISVGNLIWFLPMSLGAFILFSRKTAIIYAVYSVLLIATGITVSSFYGDYFNQVSFNFRNFISLTEITAFLFNGLIIMMLIKYKDKINILRNKELETNSVKPLIQPDKKSVDDVIKENENDYLAFFEKLDEKVKGEKQFRDSNLNISKICIDLNSNATYISRAIRAKGYRNFNIYINTLRVNHVKVLLREQDLTKVTLFSIYTEAGFSNQPTFNRVFKQIEGVTPSDYMKNL